jgi:uncharacterized protein YndB with AHSA1/START domain
MRVAGTSTGRMRVRCAALLFALGGAGFAAAETSSVSASGFTVTHQREVKATPHQVFESIGQVAHWWNGAHTWSGDAANLSLELSAGGCFCERWSGGSVQHAVVVRVGRDRTLRLHGSLGPLQDLAVDGVLGFDVATSEGKTILTVSYRVSGAPSAGLEALAAPVDRVIGEQVGRLAAFIEGRPL